MRGIGHEAEALIVLPGMRPVPLALPIGGFCKPGISGASEAWAACIGATSPQIFGDERDEEPISFDEHLEEASRRGRWLYSRFSSVSSSRSMKCGSSPPVIALSLLRGEVGKFCVVLRTPGSCRCGKIPRRGPHAQQVEDAHQGASAGGATRRKLSPP